MSNIPQPVLTDQMMSNILDISYVRDHLEIRLVPEHQLEDYRKNHRCYLQLPHVDFGIGFAVRISNQMGVTVTEDYLMSLGLDFKDLWQIWLQSDIDTIKCETMDEILASFFLPVDPFQPDENKESFLYVCTYKENSPGAGCILHPQVQSHFLEIFPEGFYIIFSSVHEAIIVPQKGMNPRDLQEMLREINARPDVVCPHEVATDFIYGVVKPYQLERMVVD